MKLGSVYEVQGIRRRVVGGGGVGVGGGVRKYKVCRIPYV
jgi:hypothetical protein